MMWHSENSLPDWLAAGGAATAPAKRWRGARGGLVRRSADAFAALLARLMGEGQGSPIGPLAAIDPRAKLLSAAALLTAVSLLHGTRPLMAAAGFAWLAAIASGAGKKRLLSAFLALPLFSSAVLLPAIFNIVTPGEQVFVVCRLPGLHLGGWRAPYYLAITAEGLAAAAVVLLRIMASAGLALALAASTTFPTILSALRGLGVGGHATASISMAGRYLALLAKAAREINLAKLSRGLAQPPSREGREWAAAGIAELFRRSRHLADGVCMAMASRGYKGQVQPAARRRWGAADWACLALCLASAAWLLLLDRRPV